MYDRDETQITSSYSKRTKLPMDSKRWNEDETATLIELLEERGCLWNVLCKEYSIKDVKEKASRGS